MNTIEIELKKYFQLQKYRPELFKESDLLPIELDIKVIEKYMADTGKQIGVLYDSPYHMLIVDLIHDEKNDKYYTYERIVSPSNDAVVIVPMYNGNFVLLNQFRHSLRDFQYAFPRGFGEFGISAENNARKEIKEELGVDAKTFSLLGTIVADSGLCGDTVYVYTCEIDAPKISKGYEGIESVFIKTEVEFSDMIKQNQITDGFTLSAYSLYISNRK